MEYKTIRHTRSGKAVIKKQTYMQNEVQNPVEQTFLRKHLVGFWDYMVSPERREAYAASSLERLEERLSVLHHADVENYIDQEGLREQNNHTNYPSQHYIGKTVMLDFNFYKVKNCEVVGVFFKGGKVLYDVAVLLSLPGPDYDVPHTIIREIDSVFVTEQE